MVGRGAWLMNSRLRQVTEENLAICYPDMDSKQRETLAKNSLKHLAMTAMELAPIWQRPVTAVLNAVVEVEGYEDFKQALSDDRGLIILAPHFGSWEVIGLYLAQQARISIMYQPPENQAMQQLMYKARSRNGASMVPTDTTGVKALLQALKKGEMIGVLPDQVPPLEGGGFAPFFGVPALTTTLVKKLAKRTGARVMTASVIRLPHSGQFRMVFAAAPEAIAADDELEALTALNKSVEDTVALAPEQYQWEYKRFKKQPDGERKYYQK